MQDDENNLLSDPEKEVNNFKNYFEKLLNNTNDQNIHYLPYKQIKRGTIELEVKEPSLKEIKQIVNTLKNDKTPDEDKIKSELLKLGGTEILKNIQCLIPEV